MCRDAGVIARAIERQDRDLARQLRRAATSVVLGVYDSAEAMAYIEPVATNVRNRFDAIIGTLKRVHLGPDSTTPCALCRGRRVRW
jgi:hypothetical protein